MIFGYAFPKKIIMKQIAEQIGLAASADSGDDLHLTVPHIGDDFLQIAIPFYFHAQTSVEKLALLSSYFSMGIIPQDERRIKSMTER